MNYREKIRKAIECPQFGNSQYGEWGALRLEQRKLIRRLLNELDSADNYILKLYKKIETIKSFCNDYIDLDEETKEKYWLDPVKVIKKMTEDD
jgi:hypothetical protein